MKKTEVSSGACFGYFDSDEFEECLECKLSRECEKATKSILVEEVRRKEKRSRRQVEEIARKFRDENQE